MFLRDLSHGRSGRKRTAGVCPDETAGPRDWAGPLAFDGEMELFATMKANQTLTDIRGRPRSSKDRRDTLRGIRATPPRSDQLSPPDANERIVD